MSVQHAGDGAVPVTVRVDDAAYWLEEWYRIRDLPDDELRSILKTREAEFVEAPAPRSRLRLALLLAEGPAAVRDQARAARLLRGMDQERASESAKALTALLEQVIAEQRWSGGKLAEQRTRLDRARARIAELERQLQELTDIEQSIQQRN
ncbi:MAG: hypothetical protein PVI91_14715 [Gammaproteobacteria bacterium]|jgi:hypothetical protein